MRTASGRDGDLVDPITGQPLTGGSAMTDDDCLAWLESSPHTCVLDVADEGDATLESVGDILGVSRERIRQIEAGARRALLPRAGRSSLAAYLEADLDARDPDAENGRPKSRGKHTTARPVEDSRRVLTPPPATWTGPAHPDEVGDATATFWCAPLAAAMPVSRCCSRQVATYDGNRNTSRVIQHPRYPECARCPEGNALRERLGVVPDALPTRPNFRRLPLVDATPTPTAARVDLAEMPAMPAPTARVAWFGDDEATEPEPEPELEPAATPPPGPDVTPMPEHAAEPCDAPQHDDPPAAIAAADPPPTHTEERSMHTDSDSQSDDVKMTVKADGVSVEIASGDDEEPVLQCDVAPCERAVAAVRSDTHKALRGCCRECRHRGSAAIRDGKATTKNVVAWLGEMYWRTSAGASLPRPPATPVHVQKPADPVDAAPTASASRPPTASTAEPVTMAPMAATAILSELRDARRALDIARRVGGIDSLEAIVNELVALRG